MYSVVVLLLTATLQAAAPFQPVACEGAYPKHLQGVCTNGKDAIYWSWTDAIVKTGLDGRIQKKVPAPSHQGDLCHHDGKVYVAVNLGKFNEPAGQADSWVFVFHGNTLEELSRHAVPELVHGAGGMAENKAPQGVGNTARLRLARPHPEKGLILDTQP
jgi:hypothetical protein